MVKREHSIWLGEHSTWETEGGRKKVEADIFW
jgi:hypothetical protein